MKSKNSQLTYVIGDVHGCFHTMKKLLDKLPQESRIIFVGDLCDKGNFSKEVIEYVIEKGYECVKGNHEHLMEVYLRDAIERDIHSPWSSDYRYGGIQTYTSYTEDKKTMEKHLQWISTLPTYIEVENYFITHGYGLPLYAHRDDASYYNDFLLSRYEEGMPHHESDKINIFGHCAFKEVVSGKNFYCIDTRCSYGQKLTAIELGSHKMFQEVMDPLDSQYNIKELELHHIDVLANSANLKELMEHIDEVFEQFDLVSSEVAEFLVSRYEHRGIEALYVMLDKKQLFNKQAVKIIQKFKEGNPLMQDLLP